MDLAIAIVAAILGTVSLGLQVARVLLDRRRRREALLKAKAMLRLPEHEQ
jgi:hypothetical protein